MISFDVKNLFTNVSLHENDRNNFVENLPGKGN